MAGKFYAVKKGKVPGIYTSWDACKSMVHGFPGAVYKGFATRAEAEQFLEGKKEEQKEPENYAFVDGSFNSATSVYGYGGFLVTKGERHVISGSGNDPQMASMRNVAGEVLGSMAAVKEAVAMGLPLGIWSANSKRCDKILHPILDLMQTMPAFVYLIPAVLFFGLGTVPGAFATIIFAMPPVVRLTHIRVFLPRLWK